MDRGSDKHGPRQVEELAHEVVVDQVRQLPSGQTYRNANDVWAALGHGVEQERF